MKAWTPNSFGRHARAAMPGACMVPGPGGGAGVAKRSAGNVTRSSGRQDGVPVCAPTSYKKRRKAAVQNFGNQSGMLEAEKRVIRLIESEDPVAAAELFLKSGEDAVPSASSLLLALLEIGDLSTALQVAHASKVCKPLSQADVVSCLAAVPHSAQVREGDAILEALISASDWPLQEHANNFRQKAGPIMLRFFQKVDDEGTYVDSLAAIPCEDVNEGVSGAAPVQQNLAVAPSQITCTLIEVPDQESDAGVEEDKTTLTKPRSKQSTAGGADSKRDVTSKAASLQPNRMEVEKLLRTKANSPSPFLNGGDCDVSSLGLIDRGRAPPATTKSKMKQVPGALGLAGYNSSSDPEEDGDEESSAS
eukprot:TRINITY_DN47913_c0_g1_i1.p1 TRINITY_DN47913_c0_g1~~TRINITY_DN47913_c0_g1_i1.p1  ORF type:complete len:363 (+),score=62.78 TRINITY_DN47913_c0_g1_i1:41-1129(+)